MLCLKLSLVVILILALTESFWWAISISTSSSGHIFHGYRRLQEQLVSDLWDIGELSLGPSRLKELDFCPQESENYIPCFNVSENLALGFSDGNEYDRLCGHGSRKSCLVLPPVNYKIPLKWPTGRDIIWVANVKITGQEVFSSSSFTKRMMMLEEDQISFRSASLMFDGVKDYSHHIAEMIGLRNESNFIQAGIRTILDIGCGYGSFGAHLFSKQLLTMCITNYESSGSQVQLTLERGLTAMIGSFNSKQLPYPSHSFDMLHCARCGIDWDEKGVDSGDTIRIPEAGNIKRQGNQPGNLFIRIKAILGGEVEVPTLSGKVQVKIGDFGLSRIKHNTLVSGGVRGTLPWMAPKLLNGSSTKVSEKISKVIFKLMYIFSYGISMWEILTGEEPYADMHCGAIIESFEKPFLECTTEFYAVERMKYMQQSDVTDYLKHVEMRLHEENERCLLYMDVITRKPLIATGEGTPQRIHR